MLPVANHIPMTTMINGEQRTLTDGTTLGALLDDLGILKVGIAVAVNERVVSKQAFGDHRLEEGDSVEIIRAVAGG